MKAGWKTRIDERRYFEEKKEKDFERVMQTLRMEAQMLAMLQQEQMRLDRLNEQLKHYPD